MALRTIDSHKRLLNKWLEHIGDSKINAQDVVAYLSWLRNEYTPQRYNGKTHPLSPKTLRNVWVTLSSFYSWAAQELGVAQIMKAVPAPRAKETLIEPLSQEGVQRMLKDCVYSREVHPSIVEASSCAYRTVIEIKPLFYRLSVLACALWNNVNC